MPRRIPLLTILCLFVFAYGGAPGSAQGRASGDKGLKKDLKRAEAVLTKLRRLEAAAASVDPKAFTGAARKLLPGLFSAVAQLRDGDVKTDLSTAAALYESAWRAAGRAGGAHDCAREVRGAYARLCAEARAARGRLLLSKALLHAGRAEASLRHARGERDAATLDRVALIRAERETDRALAEEALRELKELAADFGRPSEATAAGLEQLDRLLASLPRDAASRPLREARDALRDGLHWQLSAAPARALVVNAYAAEPGALPRLGLRADDAERAALANLRAALRFIHKAEEALKD